MEIAFLVGELIQAVCLSGKREASERGVAKRGINLYCEGINCKDFRYIPILLLSVNK